jgi:hypothetical protein
MEGNTLEIEYDWHLKVAELYDTVDLTFPMPSSTAQRIGAIAESKFMTECLERDFEPHLPTTPMPWDFIVTCPAGTLKVQVKSSQTKYGQSYHVTTSTGCTNKEAVSKDVDVVACYISPEKMWWLIPRFDLTGKTAKLNPEPTSKNKYKKYQENWSIFYE